MLIKKIRLRTVLTALAAGAVILTSGLLVGAMLWSQKTSIEDSLLESNIAYARKLADTTDRYLSVAQRELAWSATQIRGLTDPDSLRAETNRLRLQSGFFNSVVVVNNEAVVAATSPESLSLIGVKLHSETSRRAIATREPFISPPFISASGNEVVFISQPLFTTDGRYLGYIGGTIYLKKQSMLSDILSQHFYIPGTRVSIVNSQGIIIFSHDKSKIGTRMTLSAALKQQLATVQSGRFESRADGGEALTGYASLRKTDWYILIAGSPEAVTNALARAAGNAAWFIVAIIALTTILMIFLASRIAAPLETLAGMVREGGSDATPEALQEMNTWYHEADRLREAVQLHRHDVAGRMATLQDEAMTDPLTGLSNRRGFTTLTEKLVNEPVQSVIAVDIDHFKKINDWYGHDAGDAVLVNLGALLKQACRAEDVVSRFGGEEFILLLPRTRLSDAAATAERIRKTVGMTLFPFAGHLTISAGVASLSEDVPDMEALLRRADEALYQAKGAGRNRVTVSREGTFEPYNVV